MRTFTLLSDTPLLSINKAFITLKNGQRCRSKDYSAFALAISKLLNMNRTAFREFDSFFNPLLHEIHAELIQYTNELYTKDGRISKNSGDAANMEKCITDCILIGKIDDSAITDWSIKKRHATFKGFFISFKIIERTL